MNLEGFQKYMRETSRAVEGWVADGIVDSLLAVGKLQSELGINGGVMEIGVHHGKFIIGLSWLLRRGEHVLAIDVFDKQWMNVDMSGSGALDHFNSNWAQCANPEVVLSVVTADSLSMNLSQRLRLAVEHSGFRLVSVDGGHTVEHVINDLFMAHEFLADGGVVLLDDFLNPHWPGVHEGFDLYMHNYAPKLRPVALSDNKLYLTSVTFAEKYTKAIGAALSARPSYKMVKMHGWDVIVA
jgi:hypothetical protein